MTTKSELESLEPGCANAQDYLELAARAAGSLSDSDYVRHLLTQAEMQCQFPKEYVMTAEGFSNLLGDQAYAADLLEQGEDACFEGMEYAEVGGAIASLLGDRERGTALFRQGMEESTDPLQLVVLAGLAESKLGDSDLAGSLYARLEENCQTVEAYLELARSVAGNGDPDGARALYEKAARYCDDIGQTVDFAAGALTLFEDRQWAKDILEEAEMDAQFPRQFVQLAEGFKSLLNDDSKVDELLEGGLEFAMSGDEYIDLADGYWDLKSDRETAAGLYEKGLPDVHDRDALLSLARKAATDLEHPELAKSIYAKAESRVTGPGELMKLAEAILSDTGDKELVGQVYQRAQAQTVGSHGLLSLAEQVLDNLGDHDWANRILASAIGEASDFNAISRVLDAIAGQLPGATDLAESALDKLQGTADSALDYLAVHERSRLILDDQARETGLLLQAEESAENLAELKKVAETVAAHSGDRNWNERLKDKLLKREANQQSYQEFQEQEKSCTVPRHFMVLAERVVEQLEDRHYATRLLDGAEQLLDSDNFDLCQYRKLVETVDRTTREADRLRRLVRKMADRTGHFSEINQTAKLALSLQDRELGRTLAREILASASQALQDSDSAKVQDFVKFAGAVHGHLPGTGLGKELLENGKAVAAGFLDLACLSKAYMDIGDADTAGILLGEAAKACKTPGNLRTLVGRMRSYGISEPQVRETYDRCRNHFADKSDRLAWVEGLSDLFGDQDAFHQAFGSLEDEFSNDADHAAFHARVCSLTQPGQDYTRPARSIHWR